MFVPVPFFGARGAGEIDVDAIESATDILAIGPRCRIFITCITLVLVASVRSVPRGVSNNVSGLRVAAVATSTARAGAQPSVDPTIIPPSDVTIASIATLVLTSITGIAAPCTIMVTIPPINTIISVTVALISPVPSSASVRQGGVVATVAAEPDITSTASAFNTTAIRQCAATTGIPAIGMILTPVSLCLPRQSSGRGWRSLLMPVPPFVEVAHGGGVVPPPTSGGADGGGDERAAAATKLPLNAVTTINGHASTIPPMTISSSRDVDNARILRAGMTPTLLPMVMMDVSLTFSTSGRGHTSEGLQGDRQLGDHSLPPPTAVVARAARHGGGRPSAFANTALATVPPRPGPASLLPSSLRPQRGRRAQRGGRVDDVLRAARMTGIDAVGAGAVHPSWAAIAMTHSAVREKGMLQRRCGPLCVRPSAMTARALIGDVPVAAPVGNCRES